MLVLAWPAWVTRHKLEGRNLRPPGLAGISCLVEECNPGLVRVHDHSNVVGARKDKAGAGAGAGAGGTNKNTGLLSFRLRLFLE
jgi:hypothetical protein